ncbi:uncharacterized protein LY89DRAFT_724797 [Mollisia scopiformis]|uniref:Uncharacterized protein n=1 Tax=Mollisia scopiformis TaxID=149040 RepID=A0A132B8Q1_MOLSC|nr:uncharacterized protein LY89DRAFT_724797 [Mollisia scopiformis]KUJ08790.1 hypothetical protein LY89DRAFT_724797 [Mollisia scopiformis]
MVGGFGSKTVLMDWSLVKTNTKSQRQCGVRADHDHICCIKSNSHKMVVVTEFVRHIAQQTRDMIEKETRQGKSRLGHSFDVSLIDHLIVDKPAFQVQEAMPARAQSIPRQTHGLNSQDFAHNDSTVSIFDITLSLADFSVKKNNNPLPCHIMPLSKNHGPFFGRKAILEALDKALAPTSYLVGENPDVDLSNLKTVVICGPGGIGKTQLASQFAHRHTKYFDAIFWVHADESSKIAHDFTQIAFSLGLVADENSMEARDQVLTRELVLGSPASVLITSRDPIFKTHTYAGEGLQSDITLPSSDEDEAMEYLLKLTHREKELKSTSPERLLLNSGRNRSNYNHTTATVWALQDLEEKEGYPRDEMEYQDARTELLTSSLITRDRNEKKIFMHRLIQDAARASVTDEQLNRAFGFTLCQLSAAWPY